jgi:hypothetical protein
MSRSKFDIPHSIRCFYLSLLIYNYQYIKKGLSRSPKTGVRANSRTPVFGDPFNFREVQIIDNKTQSGKSTLMNETTTGIVLAGLMGFFGGLITIPLNALFSYWLKRDELEYSRKLESIAKQRELLLQHQLEMERRRKDNLVDQISERLEKVEKHLRHE